MSQHVVGLRDLDGNSEFERMLTAKRACEAAGLDFPAALVDYFQRVSRMHPSEPPENLIEGARTVPLDGAVSAWSTEGGDGFEVDVSKIPPTCKRVRFYCSW